MSDHDKRSKEALIGCGIIAAAILFLAIVIAAQSPRGGVEPRLVGPERCRTCGARIPEELRGGVYCRACKTAAEAAQEASERQRFLQSQQR